MRFRQADNIKQMKRKKALSPKGQERIRTQLSAAHEMHHLEKALTAFTKVGKKYDILNKTKQEIIDKYGM